MLYRLECASACTYKSAKLALCIALYYLLLNTYVLCSSFGVLEVGQLLIVGPIPIAIVLTIVTDNVLRASSITFRSELNI